MHTALNGLPSQLARPQQLTRPSCPNFRKDFGRLKASCHPVQHVRRQPRAACRAARGIVCAAAAEADIKPGQNFALEVSAEQQPRSHVVVTVTVPPDGVQAMWDAAIKTIRQTIDVPGFRKAGKGGKGSKGGKGKINQLPTNMMLNLVEGGTKKAKEAAVEEIMMRTLSQALQPYSDVLIGGSEKVVDDREGLVANFDVQKPFTYKIGIDILPKVSWKSHYTDIEIEVEAASSEEADRAKVEEMLLQLQKDAGTLRVVTDRGIQKGDLVLCEFKLEGKDDLGERTIGNHTGMQLETDDVDERFIPGVAAALEGMKVGDEKTFDVVLPDDWEAPALRGTAAKATAKIKEVFWRELPELTDEFVSGQMAACSGVEDARQKLFEAQQLESTQATQDRIIEALGGKVAQAVEVEVPDSMVQTMGEQEYQTQLLQMQRDGKLSMQAIEQLASPQLLQQYIDSKRDYLENLQKAVLGFDEIFRAEGLSITEEEIKAEFQKGEEQFQRQGQEFDKDRLLEQAQETLQAVKVLEYLQKNCKITVKPFAS